MDWSRFWKEVLAGIPVVAAVVGAAYVAATHRIHPYDAPTLLSYLLMLVGVLGIGELASRYTLLFSIDRKIDSFAELSRALSTGHVADVFLKDRSQFQPFAERVKAAREIYIMGISLQGLVGYHANVFVEKIRENAKIRFLLMDPSSPSVEATAHGLFKARQPAQLRRDIESTIEKILEMRDADASSVEFKLTHYVPSCGLVLIDPGKPNGVIIVELYPYLVTAAGRPHFELTRADGRWYEHFLDQFNSIWKDAKVHE